MPTPTVSDVDALVDATPASRDRVVDLLRAGSIAVVVLWHWTLSVTHWRDGRLTMPNPIGDVPGLWALTWVLQVMPVFFLVGGYANLAGWDAVVRGGGGASQFLAGRLRRLGGPVVAWLACWAVVDLAWRAAGGRSVMDWGLVVFVPLWFLGVYAGAVLAVPLTARLHRAAGVWVLAGLAGGIAVAEVVRLGLDPGGPLPGLAGSALVWLWCHQLGYWWRDGRIVAAGRTAALGLSAAGLATLVLLTTAGPYPRSMVAVRGEAVSNMYPTTACVAALGVFQLGLVLLARPRLAAWVARRGVWRATVVANGLAMTVFCWHMTALVVFLGVYERSGLALADRPTAGWWLSRPVWLVGPGLVLAAVVSVAARPGRRPAGRRTDAAQ
ncbi:MAG TPA: acyltransferase [Acidimicrobiales bacterium]|nr:acyltransferase [Acidimicrobiales bacterium]